MNIEELELENINSLAGRFTIDFRKLADAGIFVITGQTGAGKTSLLDAISYALYGKTPRQQGQGAFNKDTNELMNANSNSCMARVTFSIRGKRYSVSSSQTRTKRRDATTNFGAPSRQLDEYDADGNVRTISKKIKEIEEWIDRETGLSYPNFKRCMMLAQGEFANFLKSGEKERAEVLATITGTKIYEDIGNRVSEIISGLEKEIEKRNPSDVLPDDQRTQLEQQDKELTATAQRLNAEKTAVEKALKWLADLVKASEAESTARVNVRNAKEALEAFSVSGKLERLTKGNRAATVEGVDQLFSHAQKDLVSRQQDLAQSKEALRSKQTIEQQELAQLEQCKKAEADIAPGLREELQKVEKVLVPLELEQNKLKAQKGHLDNTVEEAQKTLAKATDQSARNQSKAQQLGQSYAEAQKSWEARQKDAGLATVLPSVKSRLSDWESNALDPAVSLRSVEDIRQAIAGLEAEGQTLLSEGSEEKTKIDLNGLAQLQKLLPQLAQGKQKVDQAQAKLAEQQRRLTALPSLEATEAEKTKAEEKVSKLRKIADIQEKLDELYQDFCQGRYEVCPCCGSTTPGEHRHPVQESQLKQANEELAQAKKAHEANVLEHNRLGNEEKAAQEQLQQAQREVASQEAQLSALLAQLGYDSVPVDLEVEKARKLQHLDRLQHHAKALQGHQIELVASEQRFAFWKELEGVDTGSTSLPSSLVEARTLVNFLSDRSESYQKLEERVEKTKSDLDLALLAVEHSKSQLEIAQQSLSKSRSEQQEKAEQLAKVSETIRATWGEESAFQRTNKLNARLTELRNAVTKQEAKVATIQAGIGELKKTISDQTGKVEETTQAYQRAEEQLCQTLIDQQFGSREEYVQARLAADELEELRKQHQVLQNNEKVTQELLDAKEKDLAELKAETVTERTAPELQEQLEGIDQQLKENNEKFIEIRAELKKDDDARRHNRELEAELAPLREELDHYRLLFEILGNQKEGFKKYAQQITFDVLIACANRQLVNLTERYTLKQNRSKNLGLQVIDLYQNDEEGRDCTNLSGGESFIVSLALALGLSQMSGSNTQIDTIFLDEGFGTLDADTLDKVLGSLEQLKASGKLIGIISHVEQLRERISQNIRVTKIGNTGTSTIEPHPAVRRG